MPGKTLADKIIEDLSKVFFRTDHFAILANYVSVTEGTKTGIKVIKDDVDGGPTDRQHVRTYLRYAEFDIIESATLGVLRPADGDKIQTTEGGQTVTWKLAEKGVVSHEAGVWRLKFVAGVPGTQGFKQGDYV